jgi:hypothetical protein
MMKTISLSTKNIKSLISNVFTDKYKKSMMADALMTMCSESQLEFLIHIMFEPDYKLLQVDDYIKFIPGKYQFDAWDKDILIDQGVLTSDGYMYGRVIGDPGYGDSFNPTHYKMTVMVILADNEGYIEEEHDIKTLDCIKIELKDVKFKNIMDIKDGKV